MPTPDLSATLEAGDLGETILVPGYSAVSSPGDPALPFQDLIVILPPNADPNSLAVSLSGSATVVVPGLHDIAPAPPAVTVVDGQRMEDWGQNKQIRDGRNTLVYEAAQVFPSANCELVDVGRMRKWLLARVRYYPYRYDPVAHKLELTYGGSLVVSFATRSVSITSPATASDMVLTATLRSIAANYAGAESWYTGGSTAVQSSEEVQTASQYAIITTSAIVAGSAKLQSFVNHKVSLGYSVEVLTESQWGGGAGDAAAQNIRAYLKANYATKHIRYVLLIGDPNPSSGAVPMKMLWPRHNSDTYREAPSDYYYADLTGNWDLDGDGYFGEEDNDFGVGGIDRYPEVIVGRIPFYGSFSDLDSILQKTIEYETGQRSGSWVHHVLLSMEPSDDKTPGYHLGEAIRTEIAEPKTCGTTRVYDDVYGLNPPADYIPCNYDNVLAAWQQHAGFHFWWTHGSTNSAADIFTSDRCQYLDDNYPSFVFQCSCSNGYPEASYNLGYSLLRQGAVATVCASRVSWYYPGQTTFAATDSNAGMTYRYAYKLLRDHLPCGDAHYQMQVTVPKLIWMNHCVFNLYGDPSLSYADGPGITHTPLADTENASAPYLVTADVISGLPLAKGSPTLLWNISGGATFIAIPMSQASGNSYAAEIPAQPYGTKVYYYISATDSSGQSATSPRNAPTALHSFSVIADTAPPAITHTPLSDTGNRTGPYLVKATVTDNRSVGAVRLRYHKNSGPDQTVEMLPQGSDLYQADIPGPTSAGDTVAYYISAVDTSINANTTRMPATGYYSFGITQGRTVAVLNCQTSPTYFMGGNTNAYQSLATILQTDPLQRFEVSVVTDLSSATLAGKEAIVLPDNAVPTADLQSVLSWFGPGRVILAMDSAACYAAYSGLMWPSAAGASGYGTYWDYSSSLNDQQVWLQDPITTGFSVGQVIECRANDAQFFTDRLPPDAKALTGKQSDPTRCYAAYRDVPGKGRIVVLGPFMSPTSGQYSIIREALAPSLTPISIAAAKKCNDGWRVCLSGKIVTCNLADYRYIEEPDRTSGIKIRYAYGLAAPSMVTVTGRMNTVNGERVLDAETAENLGLASAPAAFAQKTSALGGAGLGNQQAVMEYRIDRTSGNPLPQLLPSAGANNIGLLVRVFGRVTAIGDGYFYVDDGCACDDGSGYTGIRVISSGFQQPLPNQYVVLTAVSSTYFDRGSLFRALVLPNSDCIRTIVP